MPTQCKPLENQALACPRNRGNSKSNLLQLLELQLELEHIDQRGIDNISRDRLTHYNKVLKDQLGELELEIARVEAQFRMQFNISPFADVSPGTIMHRLGRDIAELESAIRELERDLLAFEDLGKLKAWLKGLRQQPRTVDLGGLPFRGSRVRAGAVALRARCN